MTRGDLSNILQKWKTLSDGLGDNSTDKEIDEALKYSIQNLNLIDKLLGDISQVINDASRYANGSFVAFLSSWKGVVSLARASISGSITSTIAVQNSFNSSNTSYGSTAQAQVSLAQAGVRNLEAQLAKTIVRSPIKGKIASLPLDIGELASPGQLIATVIGDQGLEVKAYTSGDDINRLKVGARVLVNNVDVGQVSSVAPSISSTNRKVEVKIAIDEATSTKALTIGETVSVKIKVPKENQSSLSNTSSPNSSLVYKLPIQDVKIEPGEAYVLTVDEENKVTKNSVILGNVDGDFVQVIEGLTDGMKIISPVYELDLGESVITE
jgi:RND family efflux transporter MFP subunit